MLTNSKNLRFRLNSQQGFKIVSSIDIVRLKAESNYTRVYFSNGDVFIESKTLREFEQELAAIDFIRVHRSHLINMMYVQGYLSKNGGIILLTDGSEIEISRSKHREFLHWTKQNYKNL